MRFPRAALTAGKIAEVAQFSLRTNDLTQMTFGFSRDDIEGSFPIISTKESCREDPFQSIDQEGVGELIAIGINRGRSVRKDLKVGICGEHAANQNQSNSAIK